MCGIAGVRRYGEKPITEEMMSLLLVGNEHRGNDATGVALQQENGEIDVYKTNTPAWKFVASKTYLEFCAKKLKPTTLAAILHTRAYTKGLPSDNNNNHPMYAGCAAIIHNGVLRNDDNLFRELRLDRKAETDSDIIRAIIDRDGFGPKAIEHLGRLAGSGAGAAFHPDFPGKMLIFRSGNPMTIGSNDDFLVFSSEKNTIHKAMRGWVLRFGIWHQKTTPDVDFTLMADDSVWILGPKGYETKYPCKIIQGTYSEPCRKTYDEYEERQKRINTMARTQTKVVNITREEPKSVFKKWAYCPDCKRDWVIPQNRNASDFLCDPDHKTKKGCGKKLIEPPVDREVVN